MDPTELDRVILMCGPAGAGKSTYARRLESQDYLRVSFDEVAWALGHRSHPVAPVAAEAVHRIIQVRIVDALAGGGRVVVDTSFWSRASRDRYRAFLAPLGVTPVVYYLATPRETVLARLQHRTGSHADDVVVPRDLAIAYLDGFETPSADEGPIRTFYG